MPWNASFERSAHFHYLIIRLILRKSCFFCVIHYKIICAFYKCCSVIRWIAGGQICLLFNLIMSGLQNKGVQISCPKQNYTAAFCRLIWLFPESDMVMAKHVCSMQCKQSANSMQLARFNNLIVQSAHTMLMDSWMHCEYQYCEWILPCTAYS